MSVIGGGKEQMKRLSNNKIKKKLENTILVYCLLKK